MRVSRQVVEHVQAGDLTVSIDYEADGRTPADVVVKSDDGRQVVLDAEVLERAAQIVAIRRLVHGKTAYCCATHGYIPVTPCEACMDDGRKELS